MSAYRNATLTPPVDTTPPWWQRVWFWIKGETAVIRPERAVYYLIRTRNGVPAEFRDAFCAEREAAGYPRPRTAAECAESGAEVESRAREGES